jgi:hypothetical protein
MAPPGTLLRHPGGRPASTAQPLVPRKKWIPAFGGMTTWGSGRAHPIAPPGALLRHPGAGRGPPFGRRCLGKVDTGLRRYDDLGIREGTSMAPPGTLLHHPGAGLGPLFGRRCLGNVDTGLYDDLGIREGTPMAPPGTLLRHPGAGRGPPFGPRCPGKVDTGLRRHHDLGVDSAMHLHSAAGRQAA